MVSSPPTLNRIGCVDACDEVLNSMPLFGASADVGKATDESDGYFPAKLFGLHLDVVTVQLVA